MSGASSAAARLDDSVDSTELMRLAEEDGPSLAQRVAARQRRQWDDTLDVTAEASNAPGAAGASTSPSRTSSIATAPPAVHEEERGEISISGKEAKQGSPSDAELAESNFDVDAEPASSSADP
jgi:hypothetical protein